MRLALGSTPHYCGTRLQHQAPIVTRYRLNMVTSNKRSLGTTAMYQSPQNAVRHRLMLPQVLSLGSALTVGY